MLRNFLNLFLLLMLLAVGNACSRIVEEIDSGNVMEESNKLGNFQSQANLDNSDFKVPLTSGYEWQITQSWAEHCSICNDKGYDEISDGYYGDFCNLSHSSTATDGCFSKCKYAWDFSLPGNDDLGKPTLASANGVVLQVKAKNSKGYEAKGWGNTVVIDHGNNVCTRYAHLKDDSITVSKGQQVCQGLKIAEIGGTPYYSPHLHFQFESCDDHEPLKMGFTDGNDTPVCTMDKDVKTKGVYTALNLTNIERNSCGWSDGQCGGLSGCPLAVGCNNNGTPSFPDLGSMDSATAAATTYLWRECVVSGKSDGHYHPEMNLTRAEALKIALQLFGLAGSCDSYEPFQDVNPEDWFYPYVLCGVKHGIISTAYNGFLPNNDVGFHEAAKIVVEAANKAGKIQIKWPDEIHFSGLNWEHWALKYLETIYYYGGISTNMSSKGVNETVSRGEYAVMAASLSPCFCSSVKCDKGCACNQENYSCETVTVQQESTSDGQYAVSATPYDAGYSSLSIQDVWTGSTHDCNSGDHSENSSGSSSGSENTTPACKPYCYNRQCGSDGCGGSCGSCPSGFFCAGQYGTCEPICYFPSCSSVGCECGSCPLLTPGCDGFSIVCGSCTDGKSCLNGKCVCTPSCSGKQCGSDGCGGICGYCNAENYCENGQCKYDPCYFCPNGQCVNGQCVPLETGWVCDPAKGYKLLLSAPDGYWEASVSPNQSYFAGNIFNSTLSLDYYCSELPSYTMVHTGSQGGYAWLIDTSQPAFDVWYNYEGPLSFTPSSPPSVFTKSTNLPPNSKTLLKIPDK